jgi:hypothetical protein
MSWMIWLIALASYALFWSWYVGFGRKISPEKIEQVMRCLVAEEWAPERMKNLRRFFENDDGKDFVMVNALHLKEPRKESRALFNKYGAAFRTQLVRRAGHPLLMGSAAASNIENVNCEAADNWTAAALVRYRSRSDFAEMVIAFAGSEHHQYKLDAMEKTFAFPAAPWFVLGGPRWLVALALALSAALAHIALV